MGSNGITIAELKANAPVVLPKTLPRNQLFVRMNNFLLYPLNVIKAPPGFGKSTLLASWAEQCGHPVAWLSLNNEDAFEERFFLFLSHIIERATNGDVSIANPHEGGFGQALTGKHLTEYIDTLLCSLNSYQQQLVCILDNFHTLDGNDTLINCLNYFIDTCPHNFHLVVVSRSLPPLRMSKRRLANAVGEIQADDLLFSQSEFQRYLVLNQVDIPEWYFERAYGMTSGLPSAIDIITKLLRDCKVAENIERIDIQFNDLLRQYFVEEYLAPLPHGPKKLIRATSFLPEFNASLAQWQLSKSQVDMDDDAVCSALRFLKDRGLLLVRRDKEDEAWYRYLPPLVDAFVSDQVIHKGDCEHSLHRHASEWYIREGMLDDAVQIASNAQDYDTIRDLILNHWRRMQESDELSVLLSWFSHLPEDYIVRYPKLCLFEVLPLGVAGDFALARKRFEQARKLSKTDDDLYSATANALYSLVLSMEGKYSRSQELAKKAIKALPDEEEHLKAMIYQTLGASSFPKDIIKAYSLLLKAEKIQETAIDRNVRCSLFANLAKIEAFLGLDNKAAKHIYAAREIFPKQPDSVVPMLAFAELAEALVAYHKGELTKTRVLLEDTIGHSRFIYAPRNIASAKALLSSILIQVGAKDEAVKLIVQAFKLDPGGIVDIFPGLIPLTEWLKFVAVDGFELLDYTNAQVSKTTSQRWLALSLSFIEGKDLNCNELDSLEGAIDPIRYPIALINTLILKTAVNEREGLIDVSAQTLYRALEKADEGHISQPFIDAYQYVKKSLRVLAKEKPGSFADVVYRQAPKRSECGVQASTRQKLSSRELDVMRLIDGGFSIRDAAERLYISEETVKKHLVHIYSKLKVHSRYEAISTIRNQGLLEDKARRTSFSGGE